MTHIVIKLDHPPFEVTEQNYRSPPEWVLDHMPRADNPDWMKQFVGDVVLVNPQSGGVEVWPPEDVERYIKNPYEECAKVAEKPMLPCDTGGDLILDQYTAETIAQAIRQLEKECGK